MASTAWSWRSLFRQSILTAFKGSEDQTLISDQSSWQELKKLYAAYAIVRYFACLSCGFILLHLCLHQRKTSPGNYSGRRLPAQSIPPDEIKIEVYNPCPSNLPLLVEKTNVFSKAQLESLQQNLKNSSWLIPFGRRVGRLGSKGVHVTFNTGGIAALEHHPDMSELFSFFQMSRIANANAWILTLKAVEVCLGFQAEKGIWKIHRDELLPKNGRHFAAAAVKKLLHIIPYSITEFHVSMPEKMLGGALWLWETDDSTRLSETAPAAVALPMPNSMSVFRGDAYHGYIGHNSTEAGPLISLILEQYKVPNSLYSQTTDFNSQQFWTEYRAKRPDSRVYHPVTEEQRLEAARLLTATQSR